MRSLKHFLLCIFLLLLAACGGDALPEAVSTEIVPETVPTVVEDAPQATPVFREGVAMISPDNASRLQSLGMLEVPAGATSTLFAHAYSPDSTRLVALNQSLLMSWNVITGQLLFAVSRSGASLVYYSSDKREIYTLIPETGSVVVYDENGDQQTSLRVHDNYNRAAAFDAESDWLAVGGTDGTIKVWSLPERQSEVTIEAHENAVKQLVFSADGTYVASVDEGGVLRVWDWLAREQIAEYQIASSLQYRLAFSPDGTQLAAATEGNVTLWDMETQSLFRELAIQPGGANSFMVYSPDGKFFFTGGASADMAVWNPVSGSIVAQIPDVSDNRLSITFSPESDLMVTTTLDRGVSLWNLLDVNLEAQQIGRANLNVETRRIVRAGWSPDGFTLAFFDTDGRVYLWGIPEAATS